MGWKGVLATAVVQLAVMVSTALSPSLARAEPLPDGLIVRLRSDPSATALAASSTRATSARLLADERVSRARLDAALRQLAPTLGEATIVQPVGRNAHLLRWPRAQNVEQLQAYADALAQRDDVASVDIDTMEPLLASAPPRPLPSDPLFARQDWMQAADSGPSAGLADLPNAWWRSTGSPLSSASDTPVAVLDTGMLAGHPDLAGRWLPGYDFVSKAVNANDGDGRDADPSDPGDWVTATEAAPGGILAGCTVQDSSWHGTLIAGEIAASTNNNVGVAGINWSTRILPVRVGGRCGAQLSDIIDAMRWAGGLTVIDSSGHAMPANPTPARIVNISFGGTGACGAALQEAVDELRSIGVVVVAAGGNTSGAVSRPANCQGVVAVGALNARGFKAPYASFGSELTLSTAGGDMEGTDTCSLAARDTGLLTTHYSGLKGPESGNYDYASVEGTSFSAPIVSGTISLMLALNPSLTVDQIVAGLKASARPHVLADALGTCSPSNAGRCGCTTATCGAGILDAGRALAYASDPVNWIASQLPAISVDSASLASCHPGGSTAPGGLSSASVTTTVPTSLSPGSGGGSVDATWLALLCSAVAMAAALARSDRRAAHTRRAEEEGDALPASSASPTADYLRPSSRLEADRGTTGASDKASRHTFLGRKVRS